MTTYLSPASGLQFAIRPYLGLLYATHHFT